MTWFTYALACPVTGVIRYIGVSLNPRARLKTHMSASAAPAVREWIKDIGTTPSLVLLGEYAIEVDAIQAERELIAKHRRTLLNSTVGGELPGKRTSKFSGFGDRLKKQREMYGISCNELGRRSGVSGPVISRTEKGGRVHLEAETAILLARALNTTVEYLVTGESP